MPKDMLNGRISRDSVNRVSEAIAERLRAHRLAAGDLVLARRGDVGRLSFVAPDEAGWVCGTGSMRIHAPNHDVLNPLFLRYAMSNPGVVGWFTGQAVGATMPNLNAKIVSAVPIAVPGAVTQRRIATTLAAFDELIEINERRIQLLEDLARSLYREWFVHFRFPGHEEVALQESRLGMIPTGWKVEAFADLASFLNGFAFKPAHHRAVGLPVIKIKELKNGVTAATPRCDESQIDPKFIVEPGDLLFSWSADLGIYLWNGERGALNQHLFKVLPSIAGTTYFLRHALSASLAEFQKRAQGTTMRHIKRSALSEVMTTVPPTDVMASFESQVGPAHREVLALHQLIAWLVTTRDLLLPRLVTGQLDISDIDLGVLTSLEAE